jgi:hypothetical protein
MKELRMAHYSPAPPLNRRQIVFFGFILESSSSLSVNDERFVQGGKHADQ